MFQTPKKVFPSAPAKSKEHVNDAKVLRDGLSANLVQQSVCHVMLLHAADTFPQGGLYEGPFAEEAARRYEYLWLPLLANYHATTADLAPPLDVAIIWYLHRLQPHEYQSYCLQKFGRTLDPSPQQAFAFTDGTDRMGTNSRVLWIRQYPAEAFYPPKQNPAPRKSELATSLMPALQALPHTTKQYLCAAYMQPGLLDGALDRYCQFLQLARSRPQLQPVALVDIELMWRTHMAMSGEYRRDCLSLFGRPMALEPATLGELGRLLEDASPAISHGEAFEAWQRLGATAGAWEALFPGTQYITVGSTGVAATSSHPAVECMYRAVRLAYTTRATPRAGGHGLLLMWLYIQAHLKCTTDTVALMRNLAQDHHLAACKKLHEKALKIGSFVGLPHSPDHRYWHHYQALSKALTNESLRIAQAKLYSNAAPSHMRSGVSAAAVAAAPAVTGQRSLRHLDPFKAATVVPSAPTRQSSDARTASGPFSRPWSPVEGPSSSGSWASGAEGSGEISSEHADGGYSKQSSSQWSAPDTNGKGKEPIRGWSPVDGKSRKKGTAGIELAAGPDSPTHRHSVDRGVLSMLCTEAMLQYSDADILALIGGAVLGWTGVPMASNPARAFEVWGWGPVWDGPAASKGLPSSWQGRTDSTTSSIMSKTAAAATAFNTLLGNLRAVAASGGVFDGGEVRRAPSIMGSISNSFKRMNGQPSANATMPAVG